jgi:hypothetical protein
MSHVVTIDLEIRDLAALADAAKALGLEFVRDQKTYRWFGVSVGDYPVPDGFTAADLGHCEHAIRIPGNRDAYEVGIVRRRDGRPGYTLIYDFYARGSGLEDRIGPQAGKLRQEYSAAVAIRHYARQGYRVRRSARADGTVVLTASR